MAEEPSLNVSSINFNYVVTAKLGTPKEKKWEDCLLICPTPALLASLENLVQVSNIVGHRLF